MANDEQRGIELRAATQSDQSGIIQLIDAVYREYGDRVCLEGAEAELLNLQSSYFDRGGGVWVLASPEGRIVGSHAALPARHPVLADGPGPVCNFRRLYLDTSLRGTGWGDRLMQHTIDWARDHGFRRVEFWSDIRFHRAHRFFDRFGFVRTDRMRTMSDGHSPYSEIFFYLELSDSDDGHWRLGLGDQPERDTGCAGS